MGADDLNSALIDALSLPVSELLSRCKAEELDHEPGETTDQDVPRIMALASAWNALHEIWQACLFDQLYARDDGDHVTLVGERSPYFKIGRVRFIQVNTQTYIARAQAERHARGLFEPIVRDAFPRRGIDVERRQSKAAQLETRAHLVDEFTRQAILPTALTDSPSITHAQLMDTFDVLSDVAEAVLMRILRAKESGSSIALDQMCRFTLSSLARTISETLGVGTPTAEQLVLALTCRVGTRFDPWATPIVPFPDGTCCLLPGVFCFANRAFSLEAFLRAEGYDMDLRGDAFENFLHAELKRAVGDCEFAAIVRVSSPRLKLLDARGVEEEIDLLIAIGRDLYVVEAKCALFPTGPSDDFFFLEKMKEADAQLARKVKYVTERTSALHELSSGLSTFPKNISSVQGIIVTTFPGGPLPSIKFPIADCSSLVHYLRAGMSVLGAIQDVHGGEADDDLVVPYFNSFETFRINFPRYVETAPHILPYAAFTNAHTLKLDFSELGLQAKPIEVATHEFITPRDDSTARQGLLSVAERLRDTFRPPN